MVFVGSCYIEGDVGLIWEFINSGIRYFVYSVLFIIRGVWSVVGCLLVRVVVEGFLLCVRGWIGLFLDFVECEDF